MSLLRLAFWLALLLLLLPTDAQQQARLSSFVSTATQRIATFCNRNGKTCETGAEVWAIFLRKAEFGMRLVGDLLGTGGRQDPPPALDRRAGKTDARGTLSPSDLYHPPWRDPRAKGD
jgi:hypothetical protein